MRRLAAAALLALAGCATTERATLLPGEDGHPVGALAVIDEAGNDRAVLATADTQAPLGKGRVRPRAVADAAINARYGALVADLPPPSRRFVLSFDVGESQPSADQETTLRDLFAEAAARPGAEVQVVGHTDTLDDGDVNDRLSRRRAEQVRAYLIRRGLPEGQVRATWRGEREPLVRTGDNVASAANRRVEVIVR